ncbi:hypothetical protein QJ857_gp0835 [Tupanvirus soda lake]|uniref:Uncharacterized protein n=2 Tax=Tupanvirus TaxID=2094720 RepID=A0A6N1NKZ1_9VIRU|nr:hypothetical protein QJ857_gp0835 [Tupanvirus soda lake]QKU35215.1 hypothetical protein [Tupanvirus soda lake]
MERILEFEALSNSKILRPLSIFHKTSINTTNRYTKRCLALCHGHNHNHKFLSKIMGDCYWYMVDKDINCYWYMVDKDINCYPDYICDVSRDEDMMYFPDCYFDVIISLHYPIGNNIEGYNNMLKILSRIIKPSGKIFLTELPKLFFWFMNSNEYTILVNNINQILGEEVIDDYFKKLIKRKILLESEKSECYKEIIVGNYRGLNEESAKEFIKSKAFEHTELYIAKKKYSITGCTNDFIIVEPLKII